MALASLSETIKNLLQIQQVGTSKPRTMGIASAGMNATGNNICNFCSVPSHFIQECEEFTRFGKCKRNPEGKVVLLTGAQVPRSVSRAWMHDRVKEWH